MSELPPASAPSDDESSTARTGVDDRSADELREQLDALLNDPLDTWLEGIHFGGGAGVSAVGFENTLSWKVTKPLRLARTFQIRVGQLGFPGAVKHSARFVQRRLGGRTR